MRFRVARQAVKKLQHYADEDVPDRLKREIIREADAAVPYLLLLFYDWSCNRGRIVAHAVELLGEIKHPSALPHLVDLLIEEDGDLDFYAHEALVRHGGVAVELLLDVLWIRMEEVAPILAECGSEAQSEEVREALCQVIEIDAEIGAHCAVLFGDPTLVEELLHKLMDLRTTDTPWEQQALVEIIEAIRTLGVELGPLALEHVGRLSRPAVSA